MTSVLRSYCKIGFFCKNLTIIRTLTHFQSFVTKEISLKSPEIDFDYLCDPKNIDSIRNNVKNRKGVGSIDKVVELYKRLRGQKQNTPMCATIYQDLLQEANEIPNLTDLRVPIGDESHASEVAYHGHKKIFSFKPKSVVTLGEDLGILRTWNQGLSTGPRTYYFLGALARMEQALIRFTVQRLLTKGFTLISVPDLIHPKIIEACGFKTTGERTQVYRLNFNRHGNICLAGTAEMSLAAYFMQQNLELENLPKKVAAVSRCYRAETSTEQEEKGIYRVHQFTKVEMFGVSENNVDKSNSLLDEFVTIQKELFADLGLHFRILDMPTQELGAPAYRKYDIETWMPNKEFYGEISSASNCTDYQTRRLHIKYKDKENSLLHCHTVNGTACAVPRMVMAIMENNQNKDGTVNIPEALQPIMKYQKMITRQDSCFKTHWIKTLK